MGTQIQSNHPHFGEVVQDDSGKIVCHICGKSYKKLLTHVWQVHGYSKHEYKKMFGLNANTGLIAESTRQKLRIAVQEHYDSVVVNNLVCGGVATRFALGSQGRTKDKLREQERRTLVKRFNK